MAFRKLGGIARGVNTSSGPAIFWLMLKLFAQSQNLTGTSHFKIYIDFIHQLNLYNAKLTSIVTRMPIFAKASWIYENIFMNIFIIKPLIYAKQSFYGKLNQFFYMVLLYTVLTVLLNNNKKSSVWKLATTWDSKEWRQKFSLNIQIKNDYLSLSMFFQSIQEKWCTVNTRDAQYYWMLFINKLYSLTFQT